MDEEAMQMVWDQLTPEQRQMIHDWITENTSIEVEEWSICETILAEEPFQIDDDHDLPQYVQGDTTETSVGDKRSFCCAECSDWFHADKSPVRSEYMVLEHVLSEHLGDILAE